MAQPRCSAVTSMLVVGAWVMAGCGGSDINLGPTPTVTATTTQTPVPTPTVTPVPLIAVAGQIVVDGQVPGNEHDGLRLLPPESMPPVSRDFARSLGNADWVVDGGAARGTTDAEGRFSITGLTPGRHEVRISKTVAGNLMELALVIMVGDDGSADVVAEVTWGLVRTTSRYTQAGAAMRAVFAASGAHAITRAGVVVELGDGYRTLHDEDGDGQFEDPGCLERVSLCAGGCGPAGACTCVASCPFCDDCPQQVCTTSPLHPGLVCGPDGTCKAPPYACQADDSCRIPGDVCTCIASCPDCTDCVARACMPSCQASAITALAVHAGERVILGQQTSASAVAYLSDGSAIDISAVADWASSQPEIATIDGWGRIMSRSVGKTDITAALGAASSPPYAFEVVERPALRRILVQNASCYYYAYPTIDPATARPEAPPMDGLIPPPWCQGVIRIGAQLQFVALGEFDTGYYEDLTAQVVWSAEPAGVGDIEAGTFTGRTAGTARVRAVLDDIESDAIEVRVVEQATIIELSIYPVGRGYIAAPDAASLPFPCADCGYFTLALLRGDTVRLAATARYDTGEWADVTSSVTWRTSDAGVAAIDPEGVLTALDAGSAGVDAALGDVTSAPVSVRVVNEATVVSLYAYQDGQDRVVARGEQAFFRAVAYYDIGFDRDVTDTAVWRSSDERIGGFDTPGVFTGRSAGTVTVWAELDGQQTPPLAIEVFATSELAYCDPDTVNRATWSDGFNRVTLESDCAEYTLPGVVSLRFSVTETERPGGIFDPCLDLYAYRADELVRVIREEGCGEPFLAPSAPGRDEAALRYQLTAFWDLKDAAGQPVPPGTYTIFGRFYLYYDPVVELTVRVN